MACLKGSDGVRAVRALSGASAACALLTLDGVTSCVAFGLRGVLPRHLPAQNWNGQGEPDCLIKT